MNSRVLPQSSLDRWLPLAPGLALSAALTVVAIQAAATDWAQGHGLSALNIAILLGMLVGNTLYPRIGAPCGPGVALSRQALLRLGVILYGFRLTVQDVGHVGMTGVLIDAVIVASTFVLADLIGTRWLGMERSAAMLIGTGSAVCGAAAVMAAEPVVKGRAEHVTMAVATVVVFGTLAMFLYPFLYDLNRHWHWIPGGFQEFGIYIGSTVHEVAQVVVAARSVSSQAADTAVITKMVRVMMLGPFLVGLSAWLARSRPVEDVKTGPDTRTRGITIPWFAFVFVGVVLFNSLRLVPGPALMRINTFDTFILAMAMAALGVSTHIGSVRRAGLRPLLLAALLFVWLVLGGAMINRVATSLFS
jgi:uncharacterized integral membrane protein (TIGR00698 family)